MDCMRLIVEHDKLQKIKNLQATALDNLFDINRILATKSGRNIELGGQNDPFKKKKKQILILGLNPNYYSICSIFFLFFNLS